MSDYNQDLHHEDHHETIARLREENERLRGWKEEWTTTEIARLRKQLDEIAEYGRPERDEIAELRESLEGNVKARDEALREVARLRELPLADKPYIEMQQELAGLREERDQAHRDYVALKVRLLDAEAGLTRLRADERDAYNELAKERDGLREALEKIVSFKSNESQWHTSRGGRFWACQEIARNALKETT